MVGKMMILLFVFVVWSGIGKIMFLKKLILVLCVRGICLGLIKYMYYDMDVDKLGKDSYELCKVGVV